VRAAVGDFRAIFVSIAAESVCVCAGRRPEAGPGPPRGATLAFDTKKATITACLSLVNACVDSGLVCICVRTCVYV
jgi:hypothetical protein